MCNGQGNGKYIHPNDCTKYLECSNELAYEFDCEDCNEEHNPGRCRNGRTVFDAELSLCNWADLTPCRVRGDDDGDEDQLEDNLEL